MDENNETNSSVKQNNKWKNILIVVLVLIIIALVGIMFLKPTLKNQNEVNEKTEAEDDVDDEKDKEEDSPSDNKDNANQGSSNSTAVVDDDRTLELVGLDLYKKIYSLIAKESIKTDHKELNVKGFKSSVYKVTNPNTLVSLVNDTFVDFNTATKFIPYAKVGNDYYVTSGDSGGGVGTLVYKTKVISKTIDTAVVSVSQGYCLDEYVKDFDSCKKFEFEEIKPENLTLKKINGKWLVENFESDYAWTIIE